MKKMGDYSLPFEETGMGGAHPCGSSWGWPSPSESLLASVFRPLPSTSPQLASDMTIYGANIPAQIHLC